ncbi:tripartite tricarboxylate transporter substrate binding protein [Polaromonas sp. P1(28)-13]|nr:tripartite tricarboxylate transporter substrate binding protein [Polaromonas sp. P1(28)-13]
MTKFFWQSTGSAVLALLSAQAAVAADAFPARPIRILVNTAPGGLTDVTTRLVAQKMSEILKQTVFVENRAGGDGLIGIRALKAAPADGYILLASAGTMAFQMAVKQDPGYDLLKDFTGIGSMGRSPFLMVAEPKQPYKNLAELVAAAKANPNAIAYASAGVGTAPHLATEMFMQQAGIKMMHVPYKGNGAAMPDVMAGRVATIFEAYASSSAKIKAGQLKVLAVSSTARIAALPDVPTFSEQGVPNYSYYTWLGLVAPAGTPKVVVQRLSEALRAATADKSVQDRYREDGLETMDMTSEQFNQFMEREIKQASKLVTDLGIPKQ